MNTGLILHDRFPGDISVVTLLDGDHYVTMVGADSGIFEVVDRYSAESSAALAGHAAIVRCTRILGAEDPRAV
ncbi:hypothetical protein [Paraburkholderia sp. GAS32]|uniref:hypothetical protein n=1 Tax=Paraburkholderia sp. GAS32 TaxID=3035129 RepID=UPI003D19CB57